MTTDGRQYTTGDQAALMVLCRGGCYWPGCGVAAVVEIQPGRWTLNLQRCHIAARKVGGARYDDLPEGLERDSFANMILLCIPHHLLVDRLDPESYSADELRRWKAEREKDGQAALAGLKNVTEDRLQELVATAISGYHKDMESLISRIERVDAQMAGTLRALSSQLTDFRSVQHGIDPDVAAMLYSASQGLPSADTALLLAQAASSLQNVDGGLAGRLSEAAAALSVLSESTVDRLTAAARAIQAATARLPEY